MQRGARGVGGDGGGRGPHGALAVHGGLRDGAVEAVLRDRRERLRGRGCGVQHARGRGDGAGAAGGRGEPRGGGDVRGGLGAVGRARARLTEWAHHAGGLPIEGVGWHAQLRGRAGVGARVVHGKDRCFSLNDTVVSLASLDGRSL